MKLSFEWLGDFLDLSGLNAQELADKLTMGAFEVEEVRAVGPDIVGPLVVGQILEINPHPNADKIRLTKIRLQDNEPAQEIVCGAWNIEVGQKIPVALPGAKVINRHDGSPLFIKESKIRGVTSNGMLCSAPELGIGGGGEGILILEESAKIGADAKDVLGLQNDYILHVEPRSNRGDALCVLGLARELAALFGRPLKEPSWIREFEELEKNAAQDEIAVEIENADDCPFFSARYLGSIKIGASNPQIRRRLENIGVKSINNIVDITNYVLHELGQPLHAYDLDYLSGPILTVRRARTNESILTIDQKERKLSEESLIIADREKPVGVAGVMGGKESEVSQNTTRVALEAACFTPARVRRSSRLLGLSSDSSLRFERGVDKAGVVRASNRAGYLAVKYAGAKLGKLRTCGNDKVPELSVELRMSELKRICEIDMEVDTAAELLEPLGFKSHMQADDYNQGLIRFKVPSFRQKDITREIDLVEEICRLYGYDNLPVSMPANTVAAKVQDELARKIRLSMIACGLNEAWISSLISREDLSGRGFLSQEIDSSVSVVNPLSSEHQVLRQSLLPGLIKAAVYNLDRGCSNPCLFELGKIYKQDPRRKGKQDNAQKHTGTYEESCLAAIICGNAQLSSWTEKEKNEDSLYFHIKGMLENLCRTLRISDKSIQFVRTEDLPAWFHPGRSAACLISSSNAPETLEKKNGKEKSQALLLGYLGEIHPRIADLYRLGKKAAIMELSVSALEKALAALRVSFQEIYSTPVSNRDLTVDLDNNVNQQEVENIIYQCGKGILRKVELVSVFSLSSSQKSLSYRLSFQHASETLTNESLEEVLLVMREKLSQKLNANFRA